MAINTLTTQQKALAINLDDSIYGNFAEIGAGQEVVRNFFQAGGAAGTVAKTLSAYDMTMSDIIYGRQKSGRYVCEDRLVQMLKREYGQVVDRLAESRDKKSKFFAFADTVAAKSFKGNRECHGWLGVKFQHRAQAEPSQVVIHIRMLDKANIQQQEALGIIGVNLIYAAYNLSKNRVDFVHSLMHSLSRDRIEIDMIKVEGPAFVEMDTRLYGLELVKQGFCNAIIFGKDGSPVQAAETLYKKHLVVLRGSFRPPTHVNIDMMETGLRKFKKSLPKEERKNILVLPEISMSKLSDQGKEIDNEDFLARIDLLSVLGHHCLISNSDKYHELNSFLAPYSGRKIVYVLGIYNIEQILDVNAYKDNPSGIMGALGDLVGDQTKIYVYPAREDHDVTKIKELENIKYDESLIFLFMYLLENKYIEKIEDYNFAITKIWSRTVLKMIQRGKRGWDTMVPKEIADRVKAKKLFGFKEPKIISKK